MSILIKGMKMPKNCTICRFCVPEADPENGEMCIATGRFVPPCSIERRDDCPLVEVPTPHGRWTKIGHIENTWLVSKCSECGYQTIDAGNYCPNCGAKMDAEEGEEDE